MKRKIIKLGQATYVASLPSKWIRKHQLEKGDYLECEEEGNTLLLSTEKGTKRSELTINVKQFDSRLVSSHIETAYWLGFDPITILHNKTIPRYLPHLFKTKDVNAAQFIGNEVNTLLVGCEIIEQTDTKTIIKDLGGGLSDENTDNVLRRSLFLLKDINKEIILSLEKKDKSLLTNVELRRQYMKKLLLYYSRTINNSKLDSHQLKIKNNIVSNLNFIVGTIKLLVRNINLTKGDIDKEGIAALEAIFSHIALMIDVMFKYDEKRIKDYLHNRQEIYTLLYNVKAHAKDYLFYMQLGPLMGATWYIVKDRIAENMLKG